ncbi:hypothetical protein J5N97_011668 [Dioscorea zingiberensis]|uniref:Uncharacterized protein n=1 Tax=Dioscorea zingiberensis TaxID=325984 RepID=A0A9D5D1K1_9LILI|nr:hypothetical protein J5N97_011668 [Dioscorea zingiberensis]
MSELRWLYGSDDDGEQIVKGRMVWQHWSEGMALQLKDERLGDDFQAEQLLRYINIGLLCIQELSPVRDQTWLWWFLLG